MQPAAERAETVVDEVAGVELGDGRLNYRTRRVAGALAKDPELGFPEALATEAELEGFYRLLRNEKVTAEKLLAPHAKATVGMLIEHGTALVIHDSTELRFGGQGREGLGVVGRTGNGMMAQFALAVSFDGRRDPLGVLELDTWVRTGKSATQKRKTEPKSYRVMRRRRQRSEQDRWWEMVQAAERKVAGAASLIHVMDSEADDYELLWNLQRSKRRHVLRLCYDRRLDVAATASRPGEKVRQFVARGEVVATREVPLARRRSTVAVGHHRSKRQEPRNARLAELLFTARAVVVRRPDLCADGPPKTLSVNVVAVLEKHPPKGVQPVEWMLITGEPIDTQEQIMAVVEAYRARWLIEEYFKALKTGCAFGKRQLESKKTIVNALALFIPVAWSLLRMRTLSRTSNDASALTVLTATQLKILRAKTKLPPPEDSSIRAAYLAVARLGGHLRRNGPPGWQVLGRGYDRLLMLEAGYKIAQNERSDQC